jgi:hypothetical protein
MITELFTDEKFIQLTNSAQLAVLYFASIGSADMSSEELWNNKLPLSNIIRCQLDDEITLINFFNSITTQLKKTGFKLKNSQIKFTPPTKDEALEYVIENMDKLTDQKTISAIKKDIDNFINYYESINWVVGSSGKRKGKQMCNWKTSLIKWMNSEWNKNKNISGVDEAMKAFKLLNS